MKGIITTFKISSSPKAQPLSNINFLPYFLEGFAQRENGARHRPIILIQSPSKLNVI